MHGSSEVIDPSGFRWTDAEWDGVARADLVLYELHVGTFTPEGTYADPHPPMIDLVGDLTVTFQRVSAVLMTVLPA